MITFKNQKTQKLSKAICDEGYNIPYSRFSKLLKNKEIKVDGKRINKDITVDINQTVEIYYEPELPPVNVIYEDENVVVVNKESGVFSQEQFRAVESKYGKAYFIHRLDRNTQGLIVFALNKQSESALLKGFKERHFDKRYLATVYGIPTKKSALLTAFLFKDEKTSTVKIYDKKVLGSVEIKTAYKVIKEDENTSLLEVELITGKTHQIRAHLAHIGHFILGDGKYGNGEINRKLNAKELMLKSYKLTFKFDKDSPLSYLDNRTFEIK